MRRKKTGLLIISILSLASCNRNTGADFCQAISDPVAFQNMPIYAQVEGTFVADNMVAISSVDCLQVCAVAEISSKQNASAITNRLLKAVLKEREVYRVGVSADLLVKGYFPATSQSFNNRVPFVITEYQSARMRLQENAPKTLCGHNYDTGQDMTIGRPHGE